jgi:hypothetical protein
MAPAPSPAGNSVPAKESVVARVLADAVLLVHFAFVLFVVGGLALIGLGRLRRWRWIRNLYFRVAHLAAIVFVALESIVGLACPLSVLESSLRGGSADSGFVARWVARLIYYDLPGWVFTGAYLAFACLVACAWKWVPPARRAPRRDAAGV